MNEYPMNLESNNRSFIVIEQLSNGPLCFERLQNELIDVLYPFRAYESKVVFLLDDEKTPIIQTDLDWIGDLLKSYLLELGESAWQLEVFHENSATSIEKANAVPWDNLEFDDDQFIDFGARFQGKPFTGMIYEKSKEYDRFYEYRYLDGAAHGIWREWIASSRILLSQNNYSKGVEIGTNYQWFENGQLLAIRVNDEFGKSLRRQTYYPSGILKSSSQGERTMEFYKNGHLLVETEYPSRNEKWYADDSTVLVNRYNYNASTASYDSYEITMKWLIENCFLLERVAHKMVVTFVEWNISILLREDCVSFFSKLLKHPEAFFRYRAIYTLKKLHAKEVIPLLQEMLNDHALPNFSDYDTVFSSDEMYKISKQAQLAIEELSIV